ncbi:MAG: hypothetical protein GTN69_01640 [Armatimonadetes bacterium]|nr:hypothetical protein [Armatimonadota bacterium]NIO74603.1 hypothetical protein [Armatimonadota bacterium]NIO96558.1 hypothetical protein [Armatimonadota bacterium]
MENLSNILGQKAALEILQRAVKHHRPFHAYLFHGPEAVGKATTAKAFARALMCHKPTSDGDGCGDCPSCRKMASDNHPDFRLIGIERGNAGSGQGGRWRISIDQIRQNPDKPRVTPPPLITDAFYQPIVGKWKVYVIDPADLLSPDAASALLKVLEEPPSYVVIILITSRPAMTLSTLRSRCWPVGFRLAPREEIEKALTEKGSSPQQARLFAALSEGRIGWAIANAQKEELEAARQQTIELLDRLPVMAPQEALHFAETLREIATDYSTPAQDDESEGEAAARRPGPERGLRASLPAVLDLALCWFRDLLLVSQQSEGLIANEDFRSLLTRQAAQLNPDQIRACILATLETKQYLQRFANPTLATESLALRLHQAMA